MSVQPLVFEGPDPERLLLEAWSAHGTDVRISEPTAVRRGGLFGFFAKLHYRIEVLAPEPAAPVAAARPTAGDACLAGLRAGPRQEHAAPTPGRPLPRAGAAPVAASATAHALDALVEATEDRLEVAETSPGSFDALLERVAGSLGEDPATAMAALGATDSPIAPSPPQPPRAADPGAPAPGENHAASRGPERTTDGTLAGQLLFAGVPRPLASELARRATSLAEAATLLSSPRPLPHTAGSLVAVIGPPARARAQARAIAEEVGCAPEAIAEVSPRRRRAPDSGHRVAHHPDEVADLQGGWRRGRVGVVAVFLPATGPTELAWARAVLAAGEFSVTFLVAAAGTKPEDLAHRCHALGGVDGLILEDLADTLTPATALGAGPPIVRLGGGRADAPAWERTLATALERRQGQG